jgi:hypothetical protein
MVEKAVRERQSFVVKSGKKLENDIADFLNKALKDKGVSVLFGDEIKNNPSKYSDLYNYISIPTKESKSKSVWGDIDLVAVDKEDNPIVIISCKTSFHGRFTETFFL